MFLGRQRCERNEAVRTGQSWDYKPVEVVRDRPSDEFSEWTWITEICSP
jgi:hypothetical protein